MPGEPRASSWCPGPSGPQAAEWAAGPSGSQNSWGHRAAPVLGLGPQPLRSPARLGSPGAGQTLALVLLLPTRAELLPAPSSIPPDPQSTLQSTSQKCEETRQLVPALCVNLS